MMDKHSIRAFGSAHRYFQGPDALQMVGPLVAGLGRQPLLVADRIVHGLVFTTAQAGCVAHDLDLHWVEVQGDVTRAAVQRVGAGFSCHCPRRPRRC